MHKIECDVYWLNAFRRSFEIELPFIPRKGENICVKEENAVFTVLDVLYTIPEKNPTRPAFSITLHVEEI